MREIEKRENEAALRRMRLIVVMLVLAVFCASLYFGLFIAWRVLAEGGG